MTAARWKSRIKKQMQGVGVYKAEFDAVVVTLAGVLEQRDIAFEDFIASGGETCVEHVSDRGSVNIRRNPRLQVWMDLNTQALAYWRDLGLTPSGLKKLNDAAMKQASEGTALERALGMMTGE